MKDKKILFGTFIVLLLILTTSLSYAYFSTSVSGNDNAKDVVVETGTLKLVYIDSPEIVAEHIKPGWSTTKVVTVKNTGTLDTAYNLVWQELTNEITNNELVISASCERLNSLDAVEGTCEELSETTINENKIKTNISIESGITHKYTFTITFKEMNSSQDYNQNKKFNGVLGVEESKDDISKPMYCTFDGEMVQGAEYINGGYSYRYMQEGMYSSSTLAWIDISEDGWGVQLTDKTSTNAVTSKLCTYINNKPVVSMTNMFQGSQATVLDLSSFDTSNVINMSGMFYNSKAVKLDLSSFDTSNVVAMDHMFNSAEATVINLNSFNTSNVTNMYGMFTGTQVTILDLSNFDTNNVTDMGDMFGISKIITLDLSSFDTSNVTNMYGMFGNATDLKTIYASSKFDMSSVEDSQSMFENCTSLVGGSGTVYDDNNFDGEYAKIDGGTSSPGYFTSK